MRLSLEYSPAHGLREKESTPRVDREVEVVAVNRDVEEIAAGLTDTPALLTSLSMRPKAANASSRKRG